MHHLTLDPASRRLQMLVRIRGLIINAAIKLRGSRELLLPCAGNGCKPVISHKLDMAPPVPLSVAELIMKVLHARCSPSTDTFVITVPTLQVKPHGVFKVYISKLWQMQGCSDALEPRSSRDDISFAQSVTCLR